MKTPDRQSARGRSLLLLAAGAFVLAAVPGWAAPPGPGEPYNCSGGGTTSCATDDSGCVSHNRNEEKCASAIGKGFAKAVGAVLKCHSKQAQALFKGGPPAAGANAAEETCEGAAKTQLDQAINKLTGLNICDSGGIQLGSAATEEAVLFGNSPLSLDGQNNGIYCDGTTPIGDDDAGSVPSSKSALKCEQTVSKMVANLVAAALKCHDKMNTSFFKGNDFDEESCEGTNPSHKGALDKYNQQRDKLLALNICPSCLGTQALLDAQSTNAISQLDTYNSVAYPCGLASPSGAFLDRPF